MTGIETLTLIGYAIGNAAGAVYSAIGAAGVISIATTAASFVYQLANQPGRQEVGKLNDTHVQTATYGRMIPLIWGVYPIAGNVIWSSDLKPRVKNVGGKGGKGGGTKQYEYTVDIAISLCATEVSGIRRIWADEELIYSTVAAEAAGNLDAPNGTTWDGVSTAELLQSEVNFTSMTLHKGTDTQGADPLITSYRGVGRVPGYRGQAYIVFADFECSRFGNRVPNFRFEVLTRHTIGEFRQLDRWTLGTGVASTGGAKWNFVGALPYTYFSFPFGPYRAGVVQLFFTAENSPTKYLMMQRDILNEGISIQLYGDITQNETNDWDAWDIPESQRVGVGGLVAMCGANNTLFRWYEIAGQPTKSHLYITHVGENGYESAIDNFICNYRLTGSYQWNSWFGGASIAMDPNLKTIIRCNNGGMSVWELSDDYTDITMIAGNPPDTGEFYAALKGSVFIPTPGLAILIQAYPFEEWSISTYVYARTKKPQPTYLWEIVRDLCLMAGLQETQIDVTELTDTVKGFGIMEIGSYRTAIGSLQAAYGFDGVESDYKIKFPKRGKSPVFALTEDDLGAGLDSASDAAMRSVRAQELEMPRLINLRYMDGQPRKSGGTTVWPRYSPRVAQALKMDTISEQEAQHDLPVILSDLEAQRCADRLLTEIWVARTTREISAPPKYLKYDPCDVGAITSAGTEYTVKITSSRYDNGVLTWSVADEDVAHTVSAAEVYDPADTDSTVDTWTGDTISVPTPGMLYPLDIPLLRSSEDHIGSYVAVSSTVTSWPGGTVYLSYTDGASWSAVADINNPAIAGSCQNALGAFDPESEWDDTNTLTVRLFSSGMLLASCAEAEVLQGVNLAAVGNTIGGTTPGVTARWEIIGFTAATNNGNGTWTLSHLKRAGFGTEHNADNHTSTDTFILLDAVEIGSFRHNLSGWPLIAAATRGGSLDEAVVTQYQLGNVRLKPLSPVNVATNLVGNDITVSWTRRDRYDPPWPASPGAQLSETSEAYEIDVHVNGVLKRTLTSTSPTVVYTNAMREADGANTTHGPRFTIYQMSSTVGRGFPSTNVTYTYASTPPSAWSLSGIGGIYSATYSWTAPVPAGGLAYVELWISSANNRASATLTWTGNAASATILLPTPGTYYGWIRTVGNDGMPSDFYPTSSTAGIAAISSPTAPADGLPISWIVEVFADNEPVSTGESLRIFRMPCAVTLSSIRASLAVAQSGGSIVTVDIKVAGVSVLSTLLTIDNNEKTSVTAAIPAVISDATWPDNAEISIDVTQIGNGTGMGLELAFNGVR